MFFAKKALHKPLFFWIALIFCAQYDATGQEALISGVVRDAADNRPIEAVSVGVSGGTGAVTDGQGRFSIAIPAGRKTALQLRRVGYKDAQEDIPALPPGSVFEMNVLLAPSESNLEVVITTRRLDDGGMVRERNIEALKLLPSASGNFESILPHIALGLNSGAGGELSSQYQVRGGNYDENLVYVNDFEIYRPQLVRAGQQEGLSFPNIDLVRDLSFSSGGFQARYGDKLSSVLDIKYKRPDSLRYSASAGMLGASAHIEGSSLLRKNSADYRRFRYLVGARYKTTRLLLGSLDVRGEYVPDFTDIQTYLTYDLNRDWQLGLIGNFNRSVYRFIPESLSRAFGLIDFTLQLRTVFEGQEVDDFTQAMGGISLTYLPDRERNPVYHKLLASAWRSQENERFDIIGYYLLGQLESALGSDNFGEIVNVLGTGTQQTWVRNYLTADVFNAAYLGGIELQRDDRDAGLIRSHFLQWSLRWQTEQIEDRINEWERLDSALYALPYDTTQLLMLRVLKSRNALQSQRLSGFFQDTWTWRREGVGETQLTAGVRAQYWDLNGEFFATPRVQWLYKPLNSRRDISWRLAAGLYYQPAFYRELRNLEGRINPDLRAQKSAHIVGGFTWDFLWGKQRPVKMRLITEAYYKRLWDLVSYEIDNVRLRYSGLNDSRGYAMGLDLRLNGEFVPGAESWINLSLLRTREALDGVQHRGRVRGQRTGGEVRDVARPTDRLFNLSMFFQDYLRRNKNVRVHLNLTVGSGLPFGIPDNNIVFRNPYRFEPYHRVDMGFSLLLWKRDWAERRPRHFLRFTRQTWAGLEIFNMLKVFNEASNVWIRTVNDIQYAVPNYLTGRRVNLRLRMDF